MNYDNYPHPIHRSPRAAHELQQVFEQLQLENNRAEYDGDEEIEYSDSEEDVPPPILRRRVESYDQLPVMSPVGPPPRALANINPLRSHPVAAASTSASHTAPGPAPGSAPMLAPMPAPQYQFSHPFTEQLRQTDPTPRRHPTNLVSYRPINQRLHPKLRRRTSLDTIASVTTTASARDAEFDEPPDADPPSPSLFTLEAEYPLTPNVDLGPPPMAEPPKPPSLPESLPESLRTASVDSVSSMPPTMPVSSAETHPPKGILRKLKTGKRKDSVGMDAVADKLVIERTVSVDQTSYRSNSSSASNTISSGTPSRYPISEAGNSRSSSTWTASSHDISGLTPEDLKKCKKKGINPALFAEMKAARKGKWTSPIAGNTFLA